MSSDSISSVSYPMNLRRPWTKPRLSRPAEPPVLRSRFARNFALPAVRMKGTDRSPLVREAETQSSGQLMPLADPNNL